MNLTDMMKKDAAIVDLSWEDTNGLIDPNGSILNVDAIRKPNNIKPELEMEWGTGGPDIDLNQPAGFVERNLPDDIQVDANRVIVFARDMMNRGCRGGQIVAAIKAKFSKEALKAASEGLRDQFKLEGIAGRIAIDARGYKNCKAAVQTAARSPFKSFIKFVIGCKCGDPHMIPANDSKMSLSASSGNGIDDFFGSSSAHRVSTVSHCRSTMLPLLAFRGDLDPSLMNDTFVELTNMTPLPQSVVSSIRSKKASNLQKIRQAFLWIDNQVEEAEEAKYSQPVDQSGFVVDVEDQPLDIMAPAMGELDVNPVNEDFQQEVIPNDPFSTMLDGVEPDGAATEIDLAGTPDQSQIPVELMDELNPQILPVDDRGPIPQEQLVDQPSFDLAVDFAGVDEMNVDLNGEQEVELDDAPVVPGMLNVDPSAGGFDAEVPGLGSSDIDLAPGVDPEFEGGDVIDLDNLEPLPSDLDVKMDQDMRI